jgi:hypothetical protein
VVDVVGWFYAGFNPVTPTRLMDTRRGLGGMALGPHERRDLVVQGRGGLPNNAVGAVALNVTVTEPSAAGFVTVWPTGVDQPIASNLNFTAGDTTPNAVVVGVGSNGRVSLYNNSGTAHLIVDIAGWFDLGFDAVTPERLMDTRLGLGGIRLGPGETRNLTVTGRGGVPDRALVGAVSLNVTVTEPTASGFVTVWPSGPQRPLASNINFTPGRTVANAVSVGVGDDGQVSIFNSAGNTDIVVDITGWYARSDTTGPRVESLTVSPTTIDTSTSQQYVTVTARVTDDLSGVRAGDFAQVTFISPSGTPIDAKFTPADRITGDALDGVYRTTLVVKAMSPKGDYTLRSVQAHDGAGNFSFVYDTDLAARGFSWGFRQVGDGDASAPTIEALAVEPGSIDTSAGARRVTVTARLADVGSGVSTAHFQFFNAAGQVFGVTVDETDLTSGDASDGTYVAFADVRQHSAQGTWNLDSVTVSDRAGNRLSMTQAQLAPQGLARSFEQTGPGDTSRPTLKGLTFTPTSISTAGGGQSVVVSAHVADDLSGVAWGSVGFYSPSGQYVVALLQPFPPTADGTVSGSLQVPALSESGVWPAGVTLVDAVGNIQTYSTDELAALGFASTITNN